MRAAAAIVAALALAGCAGLQTEWALQLQMNYLTPVDQPAPARPAAAPI